MKHKISAFESKLWLASPTMHEEELQYMKEAYETNYWIRLLYETRYLKQDEFQSIICDCQEIEKLLISIIKSLKE